MISGGDLHTLVLDRQGRVHSTGQGIHGVLGRGGLASTGEELDFREAGSRDEWNMTELGRLEKKQLNRHNFMHQHAVNLV